MIFICLFLILIGRLIFYDAHGRSGIAAKAYDHGVFYALLSVELVD